MLVVSTLKFPACRLGLSLVVSTLLLATAFMPCPADAQSVLATITAGSSPAAMAVNPATNKVYVLNSGSSGTAGLTVIYPTTGTTVSVNTGSFPQAVAVNSVTNTVYVANRWGNSVTVVDGSTDAVITTITVGNGPDAIAVNTATNTIYTANYTAGTVSIISGATNAVTYTVPVGTSPRALAVNPITNELYVANSGSGTVSEIDYANHVLTTFTVGTNPQALAVNPVTNIVYVANGGSGTVSAINIATSAVTSITVGTGPQAVSVDPVTNRTYVVCINASAVYYINGSNTATSISSVGTHPNALAIDTVTGIVYVSSRDTNVVIPIPEATNTVGTGISVGTYPVSVGVNPVTNQLFVANEISGTVTQLNGATYPTTAISTGSSPSAIVENPESSTIYVVNAGAGTVTPINESTNVAGSDLTVGTSPSAAVVDQGTSTVYVSNTGSGTVSAISGTSVASITVGSNPGAIAVDPIANYVYVANVGTGTSAGTVSVISGTTIAATVSVEINPTSIAVNPVTSMTYVANQGSATVSVLNNATNTVAATVSVGNTPMSLAVNPVTNITYVACNGSNAISVISGITSLGSIYLSSAPSAVAVDTIRNLLYVLYSPASGNGTVDVYAGLPAGATSVPSMSALGTVTVGSNPSAMYVNTSTNQLYVANEGSNTISVINGVTYATSSFATGTSPVALAMSTSLNIVYAANSGSSNVTAASAFQAVPLATTISGVSDSSTISTQNVFVTSSTTPSFTVQVYSTYALSPPYSSNTNAKNPSPSAVYYQIDCTTGAWTAATVNTNAATNPAVFTIPATSLSLGSHILYAFATYGNEGGTNSSGVYTGNSPEVGNITALAFSIVSAPTSLTASSVALSSDSNPATAGATVTYTATVSGTGSTPTGTVQFLDGATVLGTATLSSGVATYSQTSITAGFHAITAIYSGDATYETSNRNLLETTTGLSTPPSVTFSSTGTITSVYDYNTMKCAAGDYPDAGTRAFRDAGGNVHLFATHSINRQMVGTTLDNVTQRCPIVYQDDSSGDPSLFDDAGWLESFYTMDGNTISGLVSHDYHPYRHPSDPQCAGTAGNPNCWYSNIIQANSTDGGASFVSPPPGQARFVAGAPVDFSTSNTAVNGALVPTNIIPLNGAYYMLLWVAGDTTATGGATQTAGDCLLRTTNPADPTAWRAWDGTGFNIQFFDPYTTSGIGSLPIAQTGCTVVNVPVYPARSLMALSDSGSVVGYVVSMGTSSGVVAATSSDLIHWSPSKTVISSATPAPGSCTSANPLTGYFYYYPSFLDSASSSMNFNTVNVGDSTTYMYLTQWVNCPTNVRNLVRIPVSISVP